MKRIFILFILFIFSSCIIAKAEDEGKIHFINKTSGQSMQEQHDVKMNVKNGYGISYLKISSGILIVRVYPSSTAYNLGLKYRDIIKKIDNVDVSKISQEEFSKILSKGNKHKIKVKLLDGKTKNVVINKSSFYTNGDDMLDFATYYSNGKLEEALNSLNALIVFNPENAYNYNTRALLYEKMGNNDLAMKDYNKSINLKNDYGTAYYNRANLKYTLGDVESALIDYNAAIKYSPAHSENFVNRGFLRQDLGDYTGAIEDYTKAIQLDNKDSDTYYNRGYTYFASQQYIEAIADFTKSIHLEQNNPDAFFYRALSYGFLNKVAEYKRDLNYAKNLYMQNGQLDRYQMVIDALHTINSSSY